MANEFGSVAMEQNPEKEINRMVADQAARTGRSAVELRGEILTNMIFGDVGPLGEEARNISDADREIIKGFGSGAISLQDAINELKRPKMSKGGDMLKQIIHTSATGPLGKYKMAMNLANKLFGKVPLIGGVTNALSGGINSLDAFTRSLLDKETYQQRNEQENELINEQINEQINQQVNEQTDKRRMELPRFQQDRDAIFQENVEALQNRDSRQMMAEGGEAFPDLTGDGQVTQADILRGRGVFAEGGEASMDEVQEGLNELQGQQPEIEAMNQLIASVVEMVMSGVSEEEIMQFLSSKGLDDEEIQMVLEAVAEQLMQQQGGIQEELSALG